MTVASRTAVRATAIPKTNGGRDRRRLTPSAVQAARGARNVASSLHECPFGEPLHSTELSRAYVRIAGSLCERVVSLEMGVTLDALHAATRCVAEVAFARQVAMYLAHTIFCVSQSEVGGRFGRDRTTVKHACARIEDRRDDPVFEARLIAMEALLEEARFAMQLYALQADTLTQRNLVEVGAMANGVEDRR